MVPTVTNEWGKRTRFLRIAFTAVEVTIHVNEKAVSRNAPGHTTTAGYGLQLNSHVYTDLFITAASNHLCYFHHPTIRASNHECCFCKRQAQQFQFLPVHMCSYTRGLSKSPEQNKDLKVIQHSLCTRNQTRLIAQGRHLSGTSCHCFL